MSNPAALAGILSYCRALHQGAQAITIAFVALEVDRAAALTGWRGALRREMVAVRQAEEKADVEIAVAAMRAEADVWARQWAVQVDQYNWKVFEEVAATVRREYSPELKRPMQSVPAPRPPGVPSGPMYAAGPSFVSYVPGVGEEPYQIRYSTNPGVIYW